MTSRIRPATADDVEAVTAIWTPGWRDGHLGHVPGELLQYRSLEGFRDRATQKIPGTRVAEVDGVIVGFTILDGDEVDQLYVDAAARGTGVASRLLEDAAAELRAHGTAVPWLAVATGNARARHFYEREGWTDAGEFDYAAETGPDSHVLVSCHRMELRQQATNT